MEFIPALAAGNCVVAKAPELTPFTVARCAEIALEAGLPPGVLHVLPGGPEAGGRLVHHPDVAKIQGGQRAAGDMTHAGVVGEVPGQVAPVALVREDGGPEAVRHPR